MNGFVPHGVSFEQLRGFAERLQSFLPADASAMATQEAVARAAGYPHAHALDMAAQRWRADAVTGGSPILPSVSPRRLKAWGGPLRQAWLAGGQGAVLPALAKSWGHASVTALQAAMSSATASVSREPVFPEAPLVALGMTVSQAQDVCRQLQSAKAVGWLLTGPTGAGKTTTQVALAQVAHAEQDTYAWGDGFQGEPMPAWVTQVPMADDAWGRAMRYMTGARAATLLMPEIRTEALAAGFMHVVAETPRRAIATMYGSTAWPVWAHLAQLIQGQRAFWLSQPMAGSGHQVQVRRLCPHCSRPFDAPSTLGRTLAGHLGKAAIAHMRMQGEGCTKCQGQGFQGTTGCFSWLLFQTVDGLTERVAMQDWAGAKRLWRAQTDGAVLSPHMAGKTVLEHAWHKVAMGEACPMDVTLRLGPATEAFTSAAE
jgi:energy-coupling factor transporter ATP-binding protein EcfA2